MTANPIGQKPVECYGFQYICFRIVSSFALFLMNALNKLAAPVA